MVRIIRWSMQQGDQEIDSIILFADYNGLFAPLQVIHHPSASDQAFLDTKINAVIKEENVLAIQFHPERSQNNGKIILRNFGNLT